MEPSRYVIDETRWPLVRILAPARPPGKEEFERHLSRLDAILARRQPYVVVLDCRGSGSSSMPTDQRELLRKQRRAAFCEAQKYQRAMAFVVDSAIQRAVLGALLWLAPEPCPTRIFTTGDEADAWVTSFLVRTRAA
jgi:hypothetical protein